MPLAGVVPPAWIDAVVREDGRGRSRVERAAYELCALEALREALGSKEVCVIGADRYRNPDEACPRTSTSGGRRTAAEERRLGHRDSEVI